MSAVNLALNKPASQSSFVLPYSAQRAVDGSVAPVSRWLCNTLPGWASVDLGAVFSIDRWVVRHMGVVPGWPSPGYNMRDFKFQASMDNINWTDIDTVTNNVLSVTDRTVTEFQARYVRVLITAGLNINLQLASIMEFEVYEAPVRGIPFELDQPQNL